ncbi:MULTISPECIES: NAD(P)H-binding protein [unclassified Enterococcus]|uniref:NAD(P)H-binding protein n=1 Tax=unclassified Enterococcus TaxID=2608891 RepID=UPI001551F9D2|nr:MULTISPECIES: NAD(P)H-binding protein [unclassified Enterococcus]MBS7576368.1 NAD(P)H-binding protein [Enterococcus sp. MMGLQ5-2]MBS7583600.1 NAD(P)H-binding protein [Enterococcus sp. MMGLQ5-1]NPD11462.1 NAD(P)H-binding protein [Enterococcus sp. MMGLQ5-1]NPD36206.1 NAD(P)H-binding protein [Enterococcus sp. MMGLQ5-2]
MKKVIIIGAGGQIPEVLIPLLQEQDDVELTLFGRSASKLPYENVTKISGNASNLSELEYALVGQDIVYMNFDNKAVTDVVVEAMEKTDVKRIIQAGVLSVYGEVAEPFATWNSRMMGGRVANNRGIVTLEASDLDYTYMRMTWLYNGSDKAYVVSPKGEPFLGVQITRRAIAEFVCDNITGKRNDLKASIGLWEPGSENKAKPVFY